MQPELTIYQYYKPLNRVWVLEVLNVDLDHTMCTTVVYLHLPKSAICNISMCVIFRLYMITTLFMQNSVKCFFVFFAFNNWPVYALLVPGNLFRPRRLSFWEGVAGKGKCLPPPRASHCWTLVHHRHLLNVQSGTGSYKQQNNSVIRTFLQNMHQFNGITHGYTFIVGWIRVGLESTL